jgi:hypothetical protein
VDLLADEADGLDGRGENGKPQENGLRDALQSEPANFTVDESLKREGQTTKRERASPEKLGKLFLPGKRPDPLGGTPAGLWRSCGRLSSRA